MDTWTLPAELLVAVEQLSRLLHARLAWRLTPLLVGIFFASGRRTVTSWLRAADITDEFRGYYYFLGSLGRLCGFVARTLLRLLMKRIVGGKRLIFVLDDTPTERYGPCVEGACLHHNPTPGPSGQHYVYGHLWVTLAWAVRHPLWGTIGFPVHALLYIRRQQVPLLQCFYDELRLCTKLEHAAELLAWLKHLLESADVQVWIVVDGAYAKRPFLRAAALKKMTVISRLRRDAALFSLPAPKPAGRRGPQATYGRSRMSLALRAGHTRGWQTVQAFQYGQVRAKRIKTFLATWRPAGGRIRVVLVAEEHGWLAFFSTNVDASAEEILEAMADRNVIEQVFKQIKEVWGAGQQQLRNLWANVAAYHLCLWAYCLVEWWAWNRPDEEICDRSRCPWDDPTRRPSHNDRSLCLAATHPARTNPRHCRDGTSGPRVSDVGRTPRGSGRLSIPIAEAGRSLINYKNCTQSP